MDDFLKQQFEEMQKESERFDQEHERVEQEIKDFKEGMKRAIEIGEERGGMTVTVNKTAAEMMDEFSPLGVLLNAVSLAAEKIEQKEDPTENEKYLLDAYAEYTERAIRRPLCPICEGGGHPNT